MSSWIVVLAAGVAVAQAPAPSAPPAGSSALTAQRIVDVGVLPFTGNLAADRSHALEAQAVGMISDIEGLRGSSLATVATVLDRASAAAYQQCSDDQCRVAYARRVRVDRIIAGTVLSERPGSWSLNLTMFDTTTSTATVIARSSREASDVDALPAALRRSILDLFPTEVGRAFGSVTVTGLPSGAIVDADGARVAEVTNTADSASFRLRTGSHRLRVRAPGHSSFEQSVTVSAGEPQTIAVDLEKRRSDVPWILGGIGVAALGGGALFGLAAQGTARSWDRACVDMMTCESGFTRAKYADDQDTIAWQRGLSTGLWMTGAVALATGLIWYLVDPGSDELDLVQPTGGEGTR